MNKTIVQLLEGREDNHMMPFFWQHGEDEATLRKYMDVIHKANCRAVCVESRPHPDFCGPKWWQDMDIILDEARSRGMKVWILDDSHFPTGYANGAMKDQPDRLCKQSIFRKEKILSLAAGEVVLDLRAEGYLEMSQDRFDSPVRVFHDESVLYVIAKDEKGQILDLTDHVSGEIFTWNKPEGTWNLQIGVRSRNVGSRRSYINVTLEESCRVQIDAVYEPHWEHYSEDFGKTIAGFFSDEPELGNSFTYAKFNPLGTDQDLPWSAAVEEEVSAALGGNWRSMLPLLWEEGEQAPRVRSIYMDCLTKLVRKAFSNQLGDWCRAHGVEYIGHIIEDDGQHCRTSCSMGHYFRGLQGQDMSGIDNIGGQVLPQGEDSAVPYFKGAEPRMGEFYHYGLAKLAQSAAAIESRKKGNAMCEIFGNYGWVEGVKLEKYMADHFLVRGINQFVPHAFSAKKYPDPDCPPHFYAHGHHPQYRHFGKICGYMNRVATLTSSGKHVVPVAVLYHGELEWADSSAMAFEVPLRALYDAQIDCHVIPGDIFPEREYYNMQPGNPLVINGQTYHALVVPETKVLPQAIAKGIEELAAYGLPVYFVNKYPQRIAETGEPLPQTLKAFPVVALSELVETVSALDLSVSEIMPASDRIRMLHIQGDTPAFFLVNESDREYSGIFTFPVDGECYLYDPWDNVCRAADWEKTDNGTSVKLTLEPLKSLVVVFGSCEVSYAAPVVCRGEGTELTSWSRKLCPGIDYPNFGQPEMVTLPDDVAPQLPEFSGFLRYERELNYFGEGSMVLEITDADEGIEVFLNDSSLGIQIAPPFRYDLTPHLKLGVNSLAIEVATTLERQSFPLLDDYGKSVTKPPVGKSGLTGLVRLHR